MASIAKVTRLVFDDQGNPVMDPKSGKQKRVAVIPTRYRVFIRRKGFKTITQTFSTKKAATDYAKRLEGDREQLRAEGHAANRTMTLAQLIDEFTEQYSGKDHGILYQLCWWKEHYGQRLVGDMDRSAVRDALKTLERGKGIRGDGRGKTKSTGKKRTPATINRYKAALSTVFAHGMEEHDLPSNPCRGIKARTESRGRDRYLSDQERETLLAACRRSDWNRLHLLVFLAITTGARLGELQRLRWQDLDLKSRRAHALETKNGERRTLTLVPAAVEELMRFRDAPNRLVFESTKRPGQPFEFRKHWNAAMAAADLEGFRFHDLRHTAASYLAMNGASLLEIAQVLGHKSTAVTQRYSHLCDQHKQALVDRVMGNLPAASHG